MSVYEEIKDSRKVIESVAKTINPLFSILKTYGTVQHPMCAAADVAKLLDIKSVDNMVKGFTAKECVNARVRDENGERVCKLLTKHGMYRVLFNSHTPLGEVVREFIYIVLDKLEDEGVVYLKDVQKDMNEQFNTELKRAVEYLQNRVQCLETEISASSRILRRNTELMHIKEAENNKLSQERQALKMKIHNLQEQLIRAELDELRKENSDESLFEYLKSKYMRSKVYVYLLPSRDDSDYNYDYKDYDIDNPPDENDTMYYRLSKNNDLKVGRLVYESCFELDSHFGELKARLSYDNKTSDVILCELSLIAEHVEQIRMAPLIEKKKEKRQALEASLSEMGKLFDYE